MRGWTIVALGAAAAALILSCGDDAVTDPTGQVGSWMLAEPPYAGAWTHCDVMDDGTVWVTLLLDGSKRAAVARYEDGSWTIKEFEPTVTEALNDILMFNGKRGLACGNGGALLDYRDGEWYVTRISTNLEYLHLGGVDPSHVWVNAISRPYGVPAIFYYDGTQWREAERPLDYTSFGAFHMTGPDEGFMVARGPAGDEVFKLNGKRWSPALSFNENLHLYDISGDGDITYAVGERRLEKERVGRVYQLTPEVRNITPVIVPEEEYYYRTAYADHLGGLWVAAAPYEAFTESYRLLYWDGHSWTEATIANDTAAIPRFFDIEFVDGAGWAVGGTTFARYRN
jgi:hypothetical protein